MLYRLRNFARANEFIESEAREFDNGRYADRRFYNRDFSDGLKCLMAWSAPYVFKVNKLFFMG